MEAVTGPIPGENYTSDTRNYPWHRPPEYDDLDDALEYASKKILSPNTSLSMLTLVKNKVPISTVSEIFLMQGISRGKWTVDYALLMAGPVSHMIQMMAKASKIKYDMGIDDDKPSYTDGYFKVMKELDEEEEIAVTGMGEVLSVGAEPEPETPAMGGFVGAVQSPMNPEGMPDGDEVPLENSVGSIEPVEEEII